MKTSRVDYIDVARGLLVLLMFVVHAASPCAPSIRDPIQWLWVFEIATTGFAMMAGYTVGIRYGGDISLPQPGRLWKRCGELLIVMFWSNFLLGVVKLYVTQHPDAAVLLSWLLGLVTLHTEYNISGVLFPIALLLPLLPLIYRTEKRLGLWGGFLWFSVILMAISGLKQTTMANESLEHARNVLLVGLGGFPVLTFLAYGVVGYLNARALQRCEKAGWSFSRIAFTGLALSSIVFVGLGSAVIGGVPGDVSGVWTSALLPFARSEVMFLGVIVLGESLSRWVPGLFVSERVRLLGTYALCAFVFHRFVGQALVTILHLQGGGIGTFLLMLAAITSSTYLLLAARQTIKSLDVGLKRLYL